MISPRALVKRKGGDMQIGRNARESVLLYAKVDPTVGSELQVMDGTSVIVDAMAGDCGIMRMTHALKTPPPRASPTLAPFL